jgi:hypothetical protein
VMGAKNIDWEAMALDSKGKLWIFDVGDNLSERKSLTLYQVDPDKIKEGQAQIERQIQVRYPKSPHDVEAAIIDGDRLFLFGKHYYKPVPVYSVDLASTGTEQVATDLGVIPEIAPITDAYLEKDGRLILLTYFGLFELTNWKKPESRKLKSLTTRFLGQTESLTSAGDGKYFIGREDGLVFLIDPRREDQTN